VEARGRGNFVISLSFGNFDFFAPKLLIFPRISTFCFLGESCSFFELFFAKLWSVRASGPTPHDSHSDPSQGR